MLLKTLSSRSRSMILAFCGFSSFSIGDAAYKWLAQYHSVPVNAFYGSLMAFILLMLFQKQLGGVTNLFKSPNIKWQIIRGGLFVGQFFFLVLAMKSMSMAGVYTIIFLSPLIACLLASLVFKDSFRPIHIGIILLGLVGVVIALQPQELGLGIVEVYAFLSACFLAAANLTARKIKTDQDIPLSFMIYGVVGTIILSLALNNFSMTLPPPSHLPVFAIAAAGGSFGMYCLGHAFATGSTSTIAPFNYVQLLWGILFGAIIFGDSLHLHTITGAGCVIIAGCLLIWHEQRSSKI
jgi:S-adenosylmethionine uptake transporter